MTTQPMSRSEAREYAPLWGSFVQNGDPGACMYGLDHFGRPADPASRDAIVAYIDEECLPTATKGAKEGNPTSSEDVEKLAALRAHIASFTFPAPYQVGAPATVKGHDVAEFMRHYIIAMLWSSNDNSDEDTGGDPFDANYDETDIDRKTMADIESDCRAFLEQVGEHISDDNFVGRGEGGALANAGHDFWLTRVGHGAGFWDGDWQSDKSDREGRAGPLTTAAKAFGECDPYVGDDGMIHI